jgi:hypothetical protein
MQLRKAERRKARLRIGLSGPSGSGKTYSALLLASGMAPWEKIALIDSENGSGELYAGSEGIGEYNYMRLAPPFTPESYIKAIKACEEAGMDVIIIDSATHEWDGQGGCLEIVEEIARASASKNSYTAWAQVTPRHQRFLQAIVQSKCHILTTTRRKQDYDMGKDDRGKTVITKVGLKEVQREGFEYELTLSLDIDIAHNATSSKDRTRLFDGQPPFKVSKATGELLLAWASEGKEAMPDPKPEHPWQAELASIADMPSLQAFYVANAGQGKEFAEAVGKRKDEIEALAQKIKPE